MSDQITGDKICDNTLIVMFIGIFLTSLGIYMILYPSMFVTAGMQLIHVVLIISLGFGCLVGSLVSSVIERSRGD